MYVTKRPSQISRLAEIRNIIYTANLILNAPQETTCVSILTSLLVASKCTTHQIEEIIALLNLERRESLVLTTFFHHEVPPMNIARNTRLGLIVMMLSLSALRRSIDLPTYSVVPLHHADVVDLITAGTLDSLGALGLNITDQVIAVVSDAVTFILTDTKSSVRERHIGRIVGLLANADFNLTFKHFMDECKAVL